jgi:hypothetical protein
MSDSITFLNNTESDFPDWKPKFEENFQNCKKLNNFFKGKVFEPFMIYDVYHSQCKNYFPNIDVSIDYRVTIIFNFSETELEEISEIFVKKQNKLMYEGCKFFWHKKSKMAYIYSNKTSLYYISDRDQKLHLFQKTLELFYTDLELKH